jgi:hypothetical protein
MHPNERENKHVNGKNSASYLWRKNSSYKAYWKNCEEVCLLHYHQDKNNLEFHNEHYYEVIIDTWYTGLEKREVGYLQVTVVKKESLLQFINIFKSLSSNVTLCSENHEHPTASISGMEFEGYCYYLRTYHKKLSFSVLAG